MANRRPSKTSDTRQAILDTAQKFFSRQGLTGTTLDQIASEVNIRRPSLIYHFSDKQTLYEAVLDQVFTQQKLYFDSLITASEPEQRLLTLLDAWLDYAIAEPDYLRLFLHNLAAGFNQKDPFWKQARPVVRMWESSLSAGQRQGVFINVDLIQFLALVGGMTAYYLLMQKPDLPIDKNSPDWQSFYNQLRENMLALVKK